MKYFNLFEEILEQQKKLIPVDEYEKLKKGIEERIINLGDNK